MSGIIPINVISLRKGGQNIMPLSSGTKVDKIGGGTLL